MTRKLFGLLVAGAMVAGWATAAYPASPNPSWLFSKSPTYNYVMHEIYVVVMPDDPIFSIDEKEAGEFLEAISKVAACTFQEDRESVPWKILFYKVTIDGAYAFPDEEPFATTEVRACGIEV